MQFSQYCVFGKTYMHHLSATACVIETAVGPLELDAVVLCDNVILLCHTCHQAVVVAISAYDLSMWSLSNQYAHYNDIIYTRQSCCERLDGCFTSVLRCWTRWTSYCSTNFLQVPAKPRRACSMIIYMPVMQVPNVIYSSLAQTLPFPHNLVQICQ